MVIGITDNMGSEHKLQQYIGWMQRGNILFRWTVISYLRSNLEAIKACDGLLLTGGGDVDPILYGADPNHPKLGHVDRKRDDFERAAIDYAVETQLPLLGICRGMQIANVHFGGTLIQDLPEAGYTIHASDDALGQRHRVTIEGGSFLAEVSRGPAGDTNSFHHQAVERIGTGLSVTARAEDGIPEALELREKSSARFFLLVQWHPERLKNFHDPLSQNVIMQFFTAAEKRKTNLRERKT